MTFKLTRTKLIRSLIVALCMLAVAFAVVILAPRGSASADEPTADAPAADTYAVTWEYKPNAAATEWQSFTSGKTLFTYEEDENAVGKDYSELVRAKIDLGAGTDPTYVYYSAAEEGKYLSYSGEFEGQNVGALVNATEYTVTMNGTLGVDVAEKDKSVTIKIAPRVFDLSESDFVDYYGIGESNRLWLLSDKSELGDLATYYDPAAEFNGDYGAKVTIGVLYNAYVRYTGNQQTIVLNDDYKVNNKTLKDYKNAIAKIEYSGNVAKGDANKVNKITSTVTITLKGNWTLQTGNSNKIVINKDWYIVTINNALRTLDGYDKTAVESWTYGSEVPQLSIRPEHGDNAVFTLGKDGNVISRFAIKYSGSGSGAILSYYGAKSGENGYEIDMENELDEDFCTAQFEMLGVGVYTLNVAVPAYTSTTDHEHWWANAEDETASIVYYPISRTYHFTVGCYEVTADTVGVIGETIGERDIKIKIVNNHVMYNALPNNVPEVEVTFRGTALTVGDDYELQSHHVKVGLASFEFVGKGNFAGSVPFDDMYYIDQAVNSWKEVPSIMYWTYGNYDKYMNLINAVPTYLDNKNDLSFKITTDQLGEIPAATALTSFRLTDGYVSDEVAKALSSLSVGTYYLFATVEGSTNYKALAPRGIAFKVFKAANIWKVAPTIDTWAEGSYSADNVPVYKALYGTPTVIIKDSNNNVMYSSVTGVNKLGSATAGVYTMTATILGTNDYDGIEYSMTFTVYQKAGIPTWTIWLIVLGTLLFVALVLLILFKTKVLTLLTEKIAVEIRTKATVDATIASIRASKKNDEFKKQIADSRQLKEDAVKREEQKKARKAKAEQEKALPVEQKIAALEDKARKAEARAEKMKLRAELMQQRANRMKEEVTPDEAPAPAAKAEKTPEPAPEVQAEQAPAPAPKAKAKKATKPVAEAAATDNEAPTEN